ncbi:protein lifeguard 1-like isoform X1 [Bombus bifarius]|uniref:Protein lifeguard 1-like isoform X1 n=2 Tax=Bombus bifarius TaxID=103933 RepID=A0A6P8MZJ6_9HYME|nr:protein lifeguard 1-like isoform X1 [Bombus bifarius]XP_033313920.1 protein lifeguard 1-like isoform X1 [Bombus bifarius]XP_033313921.1 protein lifeguard 1-like isoform X1 [Bombus bifarius]
MATWQNTPGAGFYAGHQGYPPQNPGYPSQEGYPPGYPPPYGGNPPPPGPGFIPPGAPPYGQIPPGGPIFGTGPQSGMYGSNYEESMHSDGIKGLEFSDKTIRNGFIRKVYSILMIQLLITVSMIALFLFHEPTRKYVRSHQELFWISFVATLVLIICMACCTSVRRKAPMNYVFLLLFTIAESFLLATAASTYNSKEVLLAIGITAAVCFALTLFAFQTKFDFTALNAILFVILIVFVLFGIIAAIWNGPVMTLIYASIGALLFSIYLIYDTQMMIGGNHKYSISAEEYIFASLSLYIDIINIFIYILTIIGVSRD